MKNPLDSVFGQLVLMTVGLVVVSVLTLMVMVDRERAKVDVLHISRAVLSAMVVKDYVPDSAQNLTTPLGVSYIDAKALVASGCPNNCADTDGLVEAQLRKQLPAGMHIVLNSMGTLWVRADGAPYAIKINNVLVPIHRFVTAVVVILSFALIFAVLCAWRLYRPVRDLTNASRAYRTGRVFQLLQLRGPRELRELIVDFNDMVSELMEADRERAIMMASIAHDLRSPVTRMLVRADLMENDKDRAGFLRDTESMSRIIAQFLDFAGSPASSDMVSVDDYCRRHYTDAMSNDDDQDALVKLNLQAGSGFHLPEVDIDRILSNIIENSMTYGEPPVEVVTKKHQNSYELEIRDHGQGVPEEKLEHVMRPFVRLDVARQGNAHCGLGLAIVRRIVRHYGGTIVVKNAQNGGFLIRMTFPMHPEAP